MVRAIRRRDIARDIGNRTHAMHIDRKWIGCVGIALHQNADWALVPYRLLCGCYRARATDCNRQHNARE
jgi:hypothetical protein